MCRLGRVQAETGGLPDDGTTRLRLDGREVHHLMGVSCFAEQVVVSEKSVVPVPDGVPPHIAAVAGCAVITGVGAVLNVIGDCAGRALLVIGAGGVGLCAVMGARLVGAEPVIVVDVDAAKLERAHGLGATHVIDASREDVVKAVLARVPDGVHWAIEAVGRAETLAQSFACLRPGGTTVAVGLGRVGATFAVPINELVQRQKRVVGSLYGSANPLVDLPRLFRLYLAGRLPLDELVGERYPLASVNEAYAALTRGAVGRAVVVPGA
jgi:S-(hydroxymethyl)glutathione dehydrogenase/alcohol dehydrogenase